MLFRVFGKGCGESLPKTVRAEECHLGPFAFVVQVAPSGRVSKWACMGRTQKTPAGNHPSASRPDCQRGTGQDGSTQGEDKRPIDETLPSGSSGLLRTEEPASWMGVTLVTLGRTIAKKRRFASKQQKNKPTMLDNAIYSI